MLRKEKKKKFLTSASTQEVWINSVTLCASTPCVDDPRISSILACATYFVRESSKLKLILAAQWVNEWKMDRTKWPFKLEDSTLFSMEPLRISHPCGIQKGSKFLFIFGSNMAFDISTFAWTRAQRSESSWIKNQQKKQRGENQKRKTIIRAHVLCVRSAQEICLGICKEKVGL